MCTKSSPDCHHGESWCQGKTTALLDVHFKGILQNIFIPTLSEI
jgi:hypothetical protein